MIKCKLKSVLKLIDRQCIIPVYYLSGNIKKFTAFTMLDLVCSESSATA